MARKRKTSIYPYPLDPHSPPVFWRLSQHEFAVDLVHLAKTIHLDIDDPKAIAHHLATITASFKRINPKAKLTIINTAQARRYQK